MMFRRKKPPSQRTYYVVHVHVGQPVEDESPIDLYPGERMTFTRFGSEQSFLSFSRWGAPRIEVQK